MNEIWKDIKDFIGLYQVSNWGRVKRLIGYQCKNERILKPRKHKCGYFAVILYKDGVTKSYLIHRLVAQAFLPNPNNLPQVNHKNEDKELNFVWITYEGTVDESKSNLEWCDQKYNCQYSFAKTILQFDKQGNFIKEWSSMTEVEKQLGYGKGNISNCCLGKLKSTYGYIWRYKNEEQN